MDKERKILCALVEENPDDEPIVTAIQTYGKTLALFCKKVRSGVDAKDHLANAISEIEILLDQLKIMHGIENSVVYHRLTNLAQYAREKGFNNPERVKNTEPEREKENAVNVQTYNGKPKAIYESYNSHDCEAFYRCPLCKKVFGDWHLKYTDETKKFIYCPHCNAELSGVEG